MPPPGQRKIAFSAKQKKEQLKARRERKKNEERDEDGKKFPDHQTLSFYRKISVFLMQ